MSDKSSSRQSVNYLIVLQLVYIVLFKYHQNTYTDAFTPDVLLIHPGIEKNTFYLLNHVERHGLTILVVLNCVFFQTSVKSYQNHTKIIKYI